MEEKVRELTGIEKSTLKTMERSLTPLNAKIAGIEKRINELQEQKEALQSRIAIIEMSMNEYAGRDYRDILYPEVCAGKEPEGTGNLAIQDQVDTDIIIPFFNDIQ